MLIACEKQLPAVLAAIALDGIAHRIVLGLPDIAPVHLPSILTLAPRTVKLLSLILTLAEVDVVVSDNTSKHVAPGVASVSCHFNPHSAGPDEHIRAHETEWILLTSGTTAEPKLVVHSLASLVGPLDDMLIARDAVWSTFYDVRRYGGLQILFRALVGGGSMVLSSSSEGVGDFLESLRLLHEAFGFGFLRLRENLELLFDGKAFGSFSPLAVAWTVTSCPSFGFGGLEASKMLAFHSIVRSCERSAFVSG